MASYRLAMRVNGADRTAVAASAVTMVLWASAFVAIRGAGRYFGPGPLALGRVLAAFVVLAVIVAVRREGLPPRAAWPGIVGFGVLRFGVYMFALNWGEQTVDAGTASMIIGAGPVLVAVLAGLLLGEGFPRRLLAGIAVCCAGAVVTGLAASGDGRAPRAGVLLCLLAAAGSAGSQVCQKPALRHASALQVTAFGCLVGVAVMLPFVGQLASQFADAPPDASLSVLYLGVLPTALGFTTWSFALARSTAGQMAAATYTIPAIVILLSWLLLSQLPAPLSFLGGTICLAGAATTWLRRPRVVHADLSRLLRRCRGCAVRGWRRRQGQL
jgi:drug/metabolite transporter (DMT)-like permease